MGWLVDPDEQTVFVYSSQRETDVFDAPNSLLPVPAFANEFQLDVQALFSWLS